jgi:hypothetical protein
MTTFTSDDREEAYKKIVEAAPNQPGYEDAVPIPPTNQKAQAERNNEPVIWTACLDCGKRVTGDSIHTCSPQLKQLTDEEITEVATINLGHSMGLLNWMGFARAVLRKAQEK